MMQPEDDAQRVLTALEAAVAVVRALVADSDDVNVWDLLRGVVAQGDGYAYGATQDGVTVPTPNEPPFSYTLGTLDGLHPLAAVVGALDRLYADPGRVDSWTYLRGLVADGSMEAYRRIDARKAQQEGQTQ